MRTQFEFTYKGRNVEVKKGFNCYRVIIDGKRPVIVIKGQNSSAARIKIQKHIDSGKPGGAAE